MVVVVVVVVGGVWRLTADMRAGVGGCSGSGGGCGRGSAPQGCHMCKRRWVWL